MGNQSEKKKLNHPKKRPTPCAVPVMHLRLTFVAFHRVLILRFPINCTINCCMDSFIAKCFLLLKETGNFKFKGFFVLVAMDPNIRELISRRYKATTSTTATRNDRQKSNRPVHTRDQSTSVTEVK